jgi:hypothetical protein
MKKISILLSVTVLIFSSLACKALNRGFDGAQPPSLPPDVMPADTNVPLDNNGGTDNGGFTVGGSSAFPMPGDAEVSVSSEDTVIYQTGMSLDEVMSFYRDEYGKQGFTERDLLTVTSTDTFSMVFDGDKSGKAIVIQGVNFDGKVNVTITLQDI